jgi:hypothetical protein
MLMLVFGVVMHFSLMELSRVSFIGDDAVSVGEVIVIAVIDCGLTFVVRHILQSNLTK